MDEAGVSSFLRGIGERDLAVMISAKSGVSLALRQRMLTRIQR
jgi:hypothetical protein